MNVILPVAGLGTRLRPHTWSRPKPLVTVAGKTVLDHVLGVEFGREAIIDRDHRQTGRSGEGVRYVGMGRGGAHDPAAAMEIEDRPVAPRCAVVDQEADMPSPDIEASPFMSAHGLDPAGPLIMGSQKPDIVPLPVEMKRITSAHAGESILRL